MKVIYVSYNACCQNASGGVQNRLRKIANLVAERDVTTELFNPFTTKLEEGDILHVFMLSIDTYSIVQYAKKHGVKVVISTIIPLVDKKKLCLYKTIQGIPLITTYKINKMTLTAADVLITESQQESNFIEKYYSISKKKCHVIPNGVDRNDYIGKEIYKLIGNQCKYILQVGRFDKNKNQLNVIRALKGTNVNIVFIGGPGDRLYYEECLTEAKGCSNIYFLGWLKSESNELKSAYANAEVVVLPSHYETFGLVAIEGASSGAKVVLSKTLPINDFEVFDKCQKIDPNNIEDIRKKLLIAMTEEKESFFFKNIETTFSWDKIIDEHINIYKGL